MRFAILGILLPTATAASSTLRRQPLMTARVPGGDLRESASRVGCSAAAAAATWSLSTSCGLDSVSASSLVGLGAGAALPAPLATSAFCGTFAGMSSRVVAPSALAAAALGGAAAAVLVALDASDTRVLKGYGGRLGAVAALAGLASIAASAELRAAGLLYQPSLAAAAAAPERLWRTVGATVLGSAATRLWARRLALLLLVGDCPVIASSGEATGTESVDGVLLE